VRKPFPPAQCAIGCISKEPWATCPRGTGQKKNHHEILGIETMKVMQEHMRATGLLTKCQSDFLALHRDAAVPQKKFCG
jgi:hypothetical protein